MIISFQSPKNKPNVHISAVLCGRQGVLCSKGRGCLREQSEEEEELRLRTEGS